MDPYGWMLKLRNGFMKGLWGVVTLINRHFWLWSTVAIIFIVFKPILKASLCLRANAQRSEYGSTLIAVIVISSKVHSHARLSLLTISHSLLSFSFDRLAISEFLSKLINHV